MNRVQYGNWIPGAVVRVYSKRRGVWHFGIAGAAQGTVLHASKDRGQFCLTSYQEFSEGALATYTWVPGSFDDQRAVLARAESEIGNPFQLAKANCEDYVNFIVTGEARSPQREGFVFAALLVLLLVGLGAAAAA